MLMFKNTKEDKFIERDDTINETEQKRSGDKSFTDHTKIDKEKMPRPDQSITIDEQDNSSVETTKIKGN